MARSCPRAVISAGDIFSRELSTAAAQAGTCSISLSAGGAPGRSADFLVRRAFQKSSSPTWSWSRRIAFHRDHVAGDGVRAANPGWRNAATVCWIGEEAVPRHAALVHLDLDERSLDKTPEQKREVAGRDRAC
jgi:hypothetical protein